MASCAALALKFTYCVAIVFSSRVQVTETELGDIDGPGERLVAVSTFPGQAALVEQKAFSVTSRRWGPCGYAKGDVLDLTQDIRGTSVHDPRAGFSSLGFWRGVASKTLSLFRNIGNSRVVPLELTGSQAKQLVERQYGIISVHVPSSCFIPLREVLANENRTWEQIMGRRQHLRDLLDTELPRACSHVAEDTTPKNLRRGRRAKKLLQALRWGYWSLFEPLTSEPHSLISVRNLDKRRFLKGDLRPRQVWHFAKMFMMTNLEAVLRNQFINHAERESKSEKERQRDQRFYLTKLLGFSNARLEFLELDSLGNCVSASEHDPMHMINQIDAYKSSIFRVTLMFRERHWQMFARGAMSLVTHPFSTIQKKFNRVNDEWDRSFYGHRLGMILKPVLKITALAGIVLGIATGGATTWPQLFAAYLFDSGMVALEVFAMGTATASTETVIAYALSQLFRVPLDNLQSALSQKAMAMLESSTYMQKFWHLLDDDDVIQTSIEDANLALVQNIERIMEGEEIAKHLNEAPEELRDGLEEETRRYVEGLVRGSFVDELTPIIEQKFELKLVEEAPEFGWLQWNRWRVYRAGGDARELAGKRIRYTHDGKSAGKNYTAYVQKAKSKWFWFNDRELSIRVELPGGQLGRKRTIALTDQMKRSLAVKDDEAYRRSQAGWLLWHDWVEYKGGWGAGRDLEKREIYLDPNLPNCRYIEGACLNAIRNEKDDPTGFPVTTASWAVYGDRDIFVDAGHSCRKEGFALTAQVKRCLMVKDADAYSRAKQDNRRKTLSDAWENGQLSASETITDEVISAMRQRGIEGVASEARAGNDILKDKCGATSITLDIEEHAQAQAQSGSQSAKRKSENQDIDIVRDVDNEIQEGFLAHGAGAKDIQQASKKEGYPASLYARRSFAGQLSGMTSVWLLCVVTTWVNRAA